MADGSVIRADQVTSLAPAAPPKGAAPGERWIDVDLDRQVLTAEFFTTWLTQIVYGEPRLPAG